MRNACKSVHRALRAIAPFLAMTASFAFVSLILPVAPARAMLDPDSIEQLLRKAWLQKSDLSSPVIWDLYSQETESSDPQMTRAIKSHQTCRGYIPANGSEPQGFAKDNSDDFECNIAIEFIALDYLGSQRDYMLTAERFREHYMSAAQRDAKSSHETSIYNELPGGVIWRDRADVDTPYPDIGSGVRIYFWKGPGYVGQVSYSGYCTASTRYHETLRARTIQQEAFIREDCPKLAGIVYNRMPEYRALAGADPSAAQSGAPQGAGKTAESSPGQNAASARQSGQSSTAGSAKSPGKLPDAALPIAVGATAALAALGALAAAFANGVPAREVVDGVAGLFNAKARVAPSEMLPPTIPDAGAAASARRALDAIEAARQQYAPLGWQTQHGEVGSAAFRQLALTDALKNAPSGASIIMSDDEAGRSQGILDSNQPGRWVSISERAHAAYERGDYKAVEGLLNEGWKEDMQHMGYSTAKEAEENLKVLDRFKENTTRPAAVVQKYVEGKLHRKVLE